MSETQPSAALSVMQLLQPECASNPYVLYAQIRSKDPIFWDKALQTWIITSYQETMAILRSSQFVSAHLEIDITHYPASVQNIVQSTLRALSRHIIYLEGPEHTPLQGMISSALSPRLVEKMSIVMQRNIDQLLDTVASQRQCDIIQDVASPYAGRNILDFYGIPEEDRVFVGQWIADYKALIEGKIGAPVSTPRRLLQALFSIGNVINYFRQLVEKRRHTPQDDFLQSLIEASSLYEALNEEDCLINYALLLIIGQETITHTISNGILALLHHPEQLQQCRDDPSLFIQASNEILRYDGPIQSLTRIAKANVVFGSKQILANQRVILSISAANRDPEFFSEPERFNIHRQEKRHLGFGYGIHGCLGAYLARMQIQIALRTILLRFPALAVRDETLEWILSLSIRGLRELPVTLS